MDADSVRRRKSTSFYDLEAKGRSWTSPAAACGMTGNEEFYFDGPSSWDEMARVIVKVGGRWVAHFGGGYDNLLMIKRIGKVLSVALSGTRAICIKFQNGVELVDSFPQWLCSLESVGKSIQLPKLKVDLATIHNDPKRLEEYNKRDTLILKKGWHTAAEYCADVGMKHKLTAGSQAIEAVRVLEPETWRSWSDNRIDWETLISLPSNFAPGGNTDNFYIGYVEGIYPYDLKSSYPFRYTDPAGMGSGLEEWIPNRKTWNDPLAVCEVSWFLDASKDGITIAPAKGDHGLAAGHCTNWLTYDERVLLENDPRVTRIKQRRCFGPCDRLPDACKRFLEIVFQWKEAGLFFAKVWLNSLHGKFAERVIKDTWHALRPEETFLGNKKPPVEVSGVGLWRFDNLYVGRDGKARPHFQPINAALVYGRARAHIISLIRRIQIAGFRVYYTDTDSIFTDCPPARMSILLGGEFGNGLGQLASEGGPYSGYILGRKLYYLEDNNGSKKIAAKGVPIKKMDSGVRRFGMYMQRSGGSDLQRQIFEDIYVKGSAKIFRTGVKSFVLGAKEGEWSKMKMIRTLSPTVGNRHFTPDGVGHYMAGAI